MIVTKDEALEIAREASELKEYGVLHSTGYYLVYNNDKEGNSIAVDICKQRNNWTGRDYFGIYTSFEDSDEGEWRFTDELDMEELADLILEIAQSRKVGD